MCKNILIQFYHTELLYFFLLHFCRTIEYMSPEVMDLQRVNSNADMWGVGCITFQLLSGGISPFFAHSRYRTMAKVLDCDYSLEQAELSKTSPEAKDFISMLLIKVRAV